MARSASVDLLQNHRFWLVDARPTRRPPFFVMRGPQFGFASISAPELSARTQAIAEINAYTHESEYVGVDVGVMTLRRGVRIGDGSLGKWFTDAVYGRVESRRTLLLLQYTGMLSSGGFRAAIPFPRPLVAPEGMIGGRAWVLWDAKPIRYRAAQDFDASSGSISVMEVDIQPRAVTEFVIPNTAAFAASLG